MLYILVTLFILVVMLTLVICITEVKQRLKRDRLTRDWAGLNRQHRKED
jgi:uncharacterized membrane protein